jgi:octaprenyl-diphosphate synthase
MTTATPKRLSSTDLRDYIQSSIGSDLLQVNQILNQQLHSPHQYMGDVLQHAGQFQGKQIRPVLLLLCQKAIAGNTNETAHTLAAVVEMIHTATLVHDDVLDDASSRRHMATVHSA